jgi:iron complex outermembrane receptor protein
MKMETCTRRGPLAAAIACVLAPLSATAQDALEEITVTARRTVESLQEAPIAVSAFTSAAMEERGIADVNDLAQFTPGLSFSQAFGRTVDRPVVRGQSNILAGVQFGVESGTAYFIDGVYYNGDIQALDFDSLQRVEVIKGPQSALYGRNTYAGAINFVTRDPADSPEGKVKLSYASHATRDVTASFSTPVGETFGFRLSGRHHEYGGEYTNTLTNKKVGSEKDESVSATLTWEPTDDFKARLFSVYRTQDDGPLALYLQGANYNNCRPGFRSAGYRGISPVTGLPTTLALFGQRAPIDNVNQYYCGEIKARPELIALNTDAIPGFGDGTAFDGLEANDWFSSLALTWDIGGSGWTVSSLNGYRDKWDLFGTDSDHSDAFIGLVTGPNSAEPLFANTNRNDTIEYSTELKLSSPSDRKLRGVIGLYYYENDDEERDLTYLKPRKGVYTVNGNQTSIENKAVFGGLSWDITDALTAGVELRYAKEQKTRQEYIDNATDPTGSDGTPQPMLEAEYSSTTPRLTVDYKVSPDVMIYGILSQGSKPGGINGAAGAAVGKPTYDQETSDNVEVGVKSSWLDNRVRLNVAAYYTKADDVQVTQALPSAGTAVTSIAVNAGSAEIKGLELELTGLLGAGFSGQATFAYTDAKFTEGCDDFQYVLNSGGYAYPAAFADDPEVQRLCSIDGKRLPMVPETQASLSLSYDRQLSEAWSFHATGTATYEGSKFVQVHNLAETGDATELGLRLGLSTDRVTITAFGRNLTDEDTPAMATRWFDLRYGSGRTGLAGTAPAPTTPPTTPEEYGSDAGSPRGLFVAPRKGAEYGVEVSYRF